MDNNVQTIFGYVYCPTCRNEKCVYISLHKTTRFYDCKKTQNLLPRLEYSFWEPKTDNYVVWRRWNALFCRKDESWLRKRKTNSFFGDISPPITINHTRTWAKKSENHSTYVIIMSTSHWLIQILRTSFPVSFYTLSVYSKATWLS